MFALRSLTRAAPRSAVRISSACALARPSWRATPAVLPAWAPAPRLAAAFHRSAVRRQDSAELVAKLQSEIAMEEDMKEHDDLSANIKEFLENTDFELEDKPGHQEVVLTSTHNDERIRVTFTIADLNNELPNEDLAEDGAVYDDVDLDTQSGGATTKGSVAQGRGSDGNLRVAPSEQEELDEDYEDDQQQGFAAHASIRIDRPGKGALAIDATAQDGDFLIENVYYFPSAELADPPTAEQDWARRTLYTGPPFNNLDEDLQILLEKYLEERGINTRLALFIPDYIDYKEQKEYVTWLNKVKSFVE